MESLSHKFLLTRVHSPCSGYLISYLFTIFIYVLLVRYIFKDETFMYISKSFCMWAIVLVLLNLSPFSYAQDANSGVHEWSNKDQATVLPTVSVDDDTMSNTPVVGGSPVGVTGSHPIRVSLPIDGQCGEDSGKVLASLSNHHLCFAGTISDITGSGPWFWNCSGFNGGHSATCGAYSIGSVSLSANTTKATVLLTDDQRKMIGIKDGPDSPTDFYTAKNGASFIMTSGSIYQNSVVIHGTYEMRVDPLMNEVRSLDGEKAAGPGDVRLLMTNHDAECAPGGKRLAINQPGGLACSEYFDRDYAGGGTYFRCPDGVTSVYFFHGENHTTPDGTVSQNGGWSGNGVAYFSEDETMLIRATQMPTSQSSPLYKETSSSAEIDGINMNNTWIPVGGKYPNPPEASMYSGSAAVVLSPDKKSLYVFHGDATLNPQDSAFCNPGGCDTISEAPREDFCHAVKTSSPVQWLNYYEGQFSQPAALGTGASLGYGSGGLFSPVGATQGFKEHNGSVTYVSSLGLYIDVRMLTQDGLDGDSIDIKYSLDGLNWSEPQVLLAPPTGTTPYGDKEGILYPRVNVVEANGYTELVLTYTLATAKDFWKWAELIRQPLQISPHPIGQ
jgi:hypothetical protein